MTLKFYNTLTKRKDVFRPLRKGMVTVYNCGPTVYDYSHIGNLRSYVFADILRRYLEYKKFKVTQIMNITDVDDKTIKGSQKQKISLTKYSKKYEKAFFEDIDMLNIKKANRYPRATEHIKEMVNLVKALLQKGYAYKSKDGIYFEISKFKDYGKFARIDIKSLKSGARVRQDEYEKENVHDFALWKFWDSDDGDVFWNTEIGKGRPGWHIECSAMSMKYLNKSFDIHTGGVDLIFPHHQNEIAQSEAATGKKFVKYWLHNDHLIVNGKKMSKSLGNFYTLRDLLKKDYDPLAIRYILFSTHYRQKLNLNLNGLKAASNKIENMRNFMERMKEGKDSAKTLKAITKAKKDFEMALDDDLNISRALAAIFQFIHEINKVDGGKKVYQTMKEFDNVLGLKLSDVEDTETWKNPSQAESEIKKMIAEREMFRKQGNWSDADKIRERLIKKGIILEDRKEGPKWKKQN
jgi:cysteinyl-tRNA synthetase